MCLSPITLKKHYRSIEDSDRRDGSGLAHQVPCGRCVLCLKRRQNSWAFRLQSEQKNSSSSCFITLTYSDCPITQNGLPTLQKKDYQNFVKRIRKSIKNSSLKYYACGEYGTETNRPHYHAIMFNLPSNYINYDSNALSSLWGHGHIDISPCEIGAIRYVTKYVMKGRHEPQDFIDYTTGEIIEDDRLPQFSLMSKKMGLNYLTPQMVQYHLDRMVSYVTLPGGILTPLPRYFRDKIFSKQERKILTAEAKEIREINFIKLFRNWEHEHIYKQDMIRKHEKSIKLERKKI